MNLYQMSLQYQMTEIGLVEMAQLSGECRDRREDRECRRECMRREQVPCTKCRTRCETCCGSREGWYRCWSCNCRDVCETEMCWRCVEARDVCRKCVVCHGRCTGTKLLFWQQAPTRCAEAPSGRRQCVSGWNQYPWIKECDDGTVNSGGGFCLW